MIVPMKKATIIMQEKDADSSLEQLRSLGILHIEHNQFPKGEDIVNLKEDIALATLAVKILSEAGYSKACSGEEQEPLDWKFVAKHLVDLHKHLQQLEEYSRTLLQRIAQWQPWGDFDPLEIEKLKEKNIYLRLYQIPAKELKNLPQGMIVKEIFTQAGFVHCVIITDEKIDLPFQEVALPKMGLEKMRARLYEDNRMSILIKDNICKYSVNRQALIYKKNDLEKQLEFREAVQGMGKEGIITYLTGYIPFDKVKEIKQMAENRKWGLLIQDPSLEDQVPTLLRNPRWVKLIRPIFDVLGILPGYRELDVSFLFLLFFSIFVGILIGDAGYGLSYLLLVIWLKKKKGANPKTRGIFLLLYILSISAIIWGLLTGTFFGQDWVLKAGIKPLAPLLNDPVVMQSFCFLLGAIHLTIAHTWRAIIKFPGFGCLADLGWILVLWAAYFLARTLILAQILPNFILPLAIFGIILVLFFTEPHKNPAKALGSGFIAVTFGLSFMSAFTDVVSYVRLFAVGLAGVAIANTTNSMAAGFGSGVFALAAGVLITIVGHALNIVLGPIAILVHGVRLNVLEFGLNHTGITWNGSLYKPFGLKENNASVNT